MKHITFSISFQQTAYLVEVTKSDAILPIYFTAYLFDDQLRTKYGKLLFIQETPDSIIEPTLSSTTDEAELKQIIVQKIMSKMGVFEERY